MLTDADLKAMGERAVQKSLGADYHADVLILTDPNGAWVQAVHKDGPTGTAAGKGPFFITRRDGHFVIPIPSDWEKAYTILQRWRDMGVPGAIALYDGVGAPDPAFMAQWLREWLPAVVKRTSAGVTAVDHTDEWEVPKA